MEMYSLHFHLLNLKLQKCVITMLGGPLVTTAWCVLGLWMEGQPPDMEGSCEYIE
jgi:hypothetical protein